MSARVLVVDDVPANVKLLEARLSAEYFDVLTASNGAEALAICARAECDIIQPGSVKRDLIKCNVIQVRGIEPGDTEVLGQGQGARVGGRVESAVIAVFIGIAVVGDDKFKLLKVAGGGGDLGLPCRRRERRGTCCAGAGGNPSGRRCGRTPSSGPRARA